MSRKYLLMVLLVAMTWAGLSPGARPLAEQEVGAVQAIHPPSAPLPSEEQSRDIKKFSFILYGDTRGRHDGSAIQYEHSMVMEGILAQIKKLRNSDFPVRFVLQTGDAVAHGQEIAQWNVSFSPVINRLTTEGGVPYFLVPGNHDVSSATSAGAPQRQAGLRNLLDANRALIPADGSPRRLSGYPTYAFGYGNAFVIGFDSNLADDEKQYIWAKNQLEGLDRSRYVNIFVFCHHAPFSSGPHSARLDESTVVLRTRYLPLFEAHHVRAVLSGHEHLYEHWAEHYTDGTGTHRMDFIVSGGGGAPLYAYHGEPNLNDYLKANAGLKVRLEHLVRPGSQEALTPYHFVVIRVDGYQVSLQVFGVGRGVIFQPYHGNSTTLQDSPK